VTLTEKPTPAAQVQAAAIGRHIYVPGGEDGEGRPLDVLEAYDPRSQEWETLPPLPAPRSRYALASLEGRLYLFGGWDGSRYCDEVFVYDPQARTWSVDEQPLPTPRRSAGAAVVEGRIYVIGGEGERGALRANERYDPTGDSGRRWESAAPLGAAVAAPAAVGILDVAYVFDPAQRLMLQYTPRTDSWAGVAIPGEVGVAAHATFLGTSVFVFGPAQGGRPGALSEYQAIFNTFLPGTTGSDR
ncbi:MAG TPA: kelch repeat-containing protein, partial [Roseiflexaceae bacterium]|nr:kelch repeat-containing protein [Roseiflexaceae bacterium]